MLKSVHGCTLSLDSNKMYFGSFVSKSRERKYALLLLSIKTMSCSSRLLAATPHRVRHTRRGQPLWYKGEESNMQPGSNYKNRQKQDRIRPIILETNHNHTNNRPHKNRSACSWKTHQNAMVQTDRSLFHYLHKRTEWILPRHWRSRAHIHNEGSPLTPNCCCCCCCYPYQGASHDSNGESCITDTKVPHHAYPFRSTTENNNRMDGGA